MKIKFFFITLTVFPNNVLFMMLVGSFDPMYFPLSTISIVPAVRYAPGF